MSDRKLIVVSGPTAVGKTAYALELAKQLNSPIISADSRQVFQELNIGVARPSIEQLNQVEHHLIAHTSIHNPYNAGIYAQEARNLINELFETHKTLVVCGGTGLYIKALLSGFDPLPPSDEKLRLELEENFSVYGIEYLQEKLRNLSIELYKKTENLNPQRLIRAIEIGSANEVPKNDIPDFNFEFETEYKILKMARPELYDRINKRVDEMIEIGLEKEAKDLEKSQNLNALQTVGYSEWWPYFRGENPLDFTVDKIKQHSRNYAKRQETWFKHQITKANASQ
jgi:tRNA dimethylallyltransferase